jgi:hypothetical protein
VSVVNSSAAVQSALTINSTAPSNAAMKKAGRLVWGNVGDTMLACVLLGILPKRRASRRLALVLFCLLLTVGLSSCGGGGSTTAPTNGGGGSSTGNAGTTAGNYKVTFTATSGSITATDYTTITVVD